MDKKKTCPQCGGEFKDQRGLRIHMSRMHREGGPKKKREDGPWKFPEGYFDHAKGQPLLKGTYKPPDEFPNGTMEPSYVEEAGKRLEAAYRKTNQSEFKNIEMFWLTMTPELAKFLIAYREPNRPIMPTAVNRYRESMGRDFWIATGQAIILDEDSRLLDGQQRLAACVESNKPFDTLVVSGVPFPAFKAMDNAVIRTGKHHLDVHRDKDGNRLKNTNAIASAITLSIKYARMMKNSYPYPDKDKVDQRFTDPVFSAHSRFSDLAQWHKESKSEFSALGITPGVGICSMFFTNMLGDERAEEFWESLISGAGLAKTSPVLAARNWLHKNIVKQKEVVKKSSTGKAGQTKGESPRAARDWMLECLAISWNMFVRGDPCRKGISLGKPGDPIQRFIGSHKFANNLLRATGDNSRIKAETQGTLF